MTHPAHFGDKHEEYYEIRFRGHLLGHHPSKAHAEKHFDEHYRKTHLEPHPEMAEEFTIAPKRPIELHCRGNFLETFHTKADAIAWIEQELAREDRHPLSPSNEDFEIVDRPAGEKSKSETRTPVELYRHGSHQKSFATRAEALAALKEERDRLFVETDPKYHGQLPHKYEIIDRDSDWKQTFTFKKGELGWLTSEGDWHT